MVGGGGCTFLAPRSAIEGGIVGLVMGRAGIDLLTPPPPDTEEESCSNDLASSFSKLSLIIFSIFFNFSSDISTEGLALTGLALAA